MNLLLVDDEAFALEALEHAINWKSLGIDQVFTCGNIKAARQICQESDIQIMICDIEMPNGTGLDLAKWLSENYPDLLILFLTCHSDFSFAKEAISYHAFAYLLKPFDIEEISQAVEEAVQQSRNRQKLNRSLLPPSRRNVCSLRSTSGCSWSAVPIRTAMPTIFSGMPPETASFLIRMPTMFPVCFTSARFRLKIRILACSLTV